jgi:hypothetical protein
MKEKQYVFNGENFLDDTAEPYEQDLKHFPESISLRL